MGSKKVIIIRRTPEVERKYHEKRQKIFIEKQQKLLIDSLAKNKGCFNNNGIKEVNNKKKKFSS